jgi:hypothetical protein
MGGGQWKEERFAELQKLATLSEALDYAMHTRENELF